MGKKLKKYLFILIILVTSIFLSLLTNRVSTKAFDNNDVRLGLDLFSYNKILPKNFRKTSDLTTIKNNKNINIKGLERLNASGSAQFSEDNLPIMIKAIESKNPITVIDLRQESHGFINGLAVSWSDSRNNANAGLTREQVLVDETNKLNSIKLNTPITFYNNPKETIVVKKVQDENQLVKSQNLSYVRITVRDGGTPTDDMVDYFIKSIKSQPENSWLHFHCKHGIGRTTSFMIMYDMVKNYKNVSADDIMKRQVELADFKESTSKSFYNNERVTFLKQFYKYCQQNGDSFNVKWSDWKKSNVSMEKNNHEYIKYPEINSEEIIIAMPEGIAIIILKDNLLTIMCTNRIITLSHMNNCSYVIM